MIVRVPFYILSCIPSQNFLQKRRNVLSLLGRLIRHAAAAAFLSLVFAICIDPHLLSLSPGTGKGQKELSFVALALAFTGLSHVRLLSL